MVFHSLRHSSVTYNLKLNGGDIKAVQGDSGHAQASMVTDVYSHILDDGRKKIAVLFEEAFYEKKNLDPQMHPNTVENTVAVPEGVDAELLAKVLNNPEMAALLTSLAKTMMQVMPPSPDWKEPLQVPYIIFPTFPRTGNNYFAPCSLPLLESCQSKKHKFIR